MKYIAASSLLFAMANSESAINDFQNEGKAAPAATGYVDELAKIDAHAASVRQLDGHKPSMCTMKAFDRDAVIERVSPHSSVAWIWLVVTFQVLDENHSTCESNL